MHTSCFAQYEIKLAIQALIMLLIEKRWFLRIESGVLQTPLKAVLNTKRGSLAATDHQHLPMLLAPLIAINNLKQYQIRYFIF